MAYTDIEDKQTPARSRLGPVRSNCPDCNGDLAVLRVIGGRGGCEYWTLRCADCGGLHLDITEPQGPHADDGPLPAA